jgi:hypothetical protein
MDTLNDGKIFGDKHFDGILKEIFLQTHGSGKVDKSNAGKMNLLFQNSNEVFHRYSHSEKLPHFDQSISWLVLDANSSHKNEYLDEILERLLKMLKAFGDTKTINQLVGFSESLRVMCELNDLSY